MKKGTKVFSVEREIRRKKKRRARTLSSWRRRSSWDCRRNRSCRRSRNPRQPALPRPTNPNGPALNRAPTLLCVYVCVFINDNSTHRRSVAYREETSFPRRHNSIATSVGIPAQNTHRHTKEKKIEKTKKYVI